MGSFNKILFRYVHLFKDFLFLWQNKRVFAKLLVYAKNEMSMKTDGLVCIRVFNIRMF